MATAHYAEGQSSDRSLDEDSSGGSSKKIPGHQCIKLKEDVLISNFSIFDWHQRHSFSIP